MKYSGASAVVAVVALSRAVECFVAKSEHRSSVSIGGAGVVGPVSKTQGSTSSLQSSSGGLFGEGSRKESARASESKADVPKGRFAEGHELKRLRSDLQTLRENLQWAEAMGDTDRVTDLTKAVKNGEKRDPEVVYANSMRAIVDTKASFQLSDREKKSRVAKFQADADAARICLPRFQLEGLWVGNFGEHGAQLINVTYTRDTLVATKTTGDSTVPRGKVSFTADLSPLNSSAPLEPLKLPYDRDATQLLRYRGKGQVAKQGFLDSKYVDGQLVMFEKHFSFVWIPTRHHVLFRRPTPEQTIRLLRDDMAKEDEMENMRDHVARCFDMDMTESLARFHANQGQEPLRRIALCEELSRLDKSLQPPSDLDMAGVRFNFWKVNKWRQYIDRVLGEPDAMP